MAAPIRFYFDYVSPYAYLAATQIRALAKKHDRTVEPVPVLFAGMLGASGGRGPAEIPLRRDYLWRDVLRLAKSLNVPIAPPVGHPFNPLLALRATTLATDDEARWQLVDRIFHAVWVDRKPLADPDVIGELAARADDAKAALRRATDDAIALGAFGVPTMIADGELFWGVDSLHLLDRFLGGERAYDAAELERWNRIQPSATRKL